MSRIELQDVSVVYTRTSFAANTNFTQGPRDGSSDRSFSERAAAQAMMDQDIHRGQGGKVVALDHVSLEIPDGQTLAIVGPSGCGKSTLLRVISGLDSSFAGKVLYDGEDQLNVPVKDRFIGMVFQSYALYPHFKGEGNLSFFFKLHKISDKEMEERIRITSEIMGIGFDALLERRPKALSGGQQQRVAIARAIVREPRLFLFDEPLSNLDAKLRMQTRIEIKRLLHRFHITSVYVTHDQAEAIAMCDQIVVMRAGRIEQMGEYQDMRANPATSFVAGFLGSPPMNLLSGGTVSGGQLQLGEIAMPLPESVKTQVEAGQELTLGIRPEEVRLAPAAGQAAQQGVRVRGAVDMVEPNFAQHNQAAFISNGAISFAAITEPDAVLVGESVEVVFPGDQLYFFDTKSDKRIR